MADENRKNSDDKDKSGNSNILIIALIALMVLIGGGVVFLLFTESGRDLAGLNRSNALRDKIRELPDNIVYYELPELLINIQSTTKKRKPYLRLKLKLEVHDPEAVTKLDLVRPRIIDSFQVFLRELRVEDTEGSSGSQRLREELLKRVNAVAAPVKVHDVLFQTFVVQ